MNKQPVYLLTLLLVSSLPGVVMAQRFVDGGGSCGGNTPCYTTIQAAVTAAATGETVSVYPGIYTEHVTISKSITLVSTNGRGSTTIVGPGGSPGTVVINGSTTGLAIGTGTDLANGFTIIGVNAATDFSDFGAVYVQGAGTHTNLSIVGNDIRANGDNGFVSEPATTINGFVFDRNILSGTTFTGNQPNQSCNTPYFSQNANNVARTLFALNPRGDGTTPAATNVRFTNNQITGTAGAGAFGNSLVQIAALNAVVEQNTFSGTTVGTAFCNRGSLRVRGSSFTIDCNQFNSAGLSGDGAYHVQFDRSDSYTGGSPTVSTLGGMAQYNNYDANPVAYYNPIGGGCPNLQRSVFVNVTAANSYTICGGTVQTVTGSCQTPLPVKWASFKGTVLENRAVQLSWQTATERNNSYFEVQRSSDAEIFTALGQVKGEDTSDKLNTYSYTDNQPTLGTNYYRLKQVDTDGTSSYSKTIAVIFRGGNFLTVYPNPATDQVSIQLKEVVAIQSVSLYDQTGRLLRQLNAARTVSVGNLAPGLYYLEVVTKDGQTYRKSIIKQ